jgi:3-oxoacyl-(acyl-carrier-protein) synthase
VNGRSAIKEISSWDASRWPVRVAAEVTGVENKTLVEDRKLHKMISRTDLFGLYAADMAIQQSGSARASRNTGRGGDGSISTTAAASLPVRAAELRLQLRFLSGHGCGRRRPEKIWRTIQRITSTRCGC